MKHLAVCLILTLLLFASPIRAEETPLYEEEVVVTATRIDQEQSDTPGRTEVISGEELTESGAANLAEALAQQGAVISSNGGDSSVATIRLDGSTAEQTLVMVNGVPANDGCVGAVDLSYFPSSVVTRVELSHGPLSALYGANAWGGVVNIMTDLTGTPRNELTTSTGENSTGRIGWLQQESNWGLALGGNYSNGYRERMTANSKYLLGQYDFVQKPDQSLSLYWQYLNKQNQVPGGLSFPLSNAAQAEQSYSLYLNGKQPLWGGSWEYKFFVQELQSSYDDWDSFFPSHDRHRAASYGLDLAGLYPLGQHELLSGLMLKWDSFASTVSGNHQQRGSGLFLQDSWSLAPDWCLVSGIRWDDDAGRSALSPRLGLNHNVGEHFTWKISYGQAFRAPTINELYWNQPAWGMFGNPELLPEQGQRYDLVGEWRSGSSACSLNYFKTYLRNGIRWVDPELDWTYTAVNIAKLKGDGLSFSAAHTWSDWFTLTLSYNYLNQLAWNELSQSYDQAYNFFGENQVVLGLKIKQGRWNCGLTGQLVQERCQGSLELPDYGVTNFWLRVQPTPQQEVIFTVTNLTDEAYQIQSDFPMPGRELRLGFNYNY